MTDTEQQLQSILERNRRVELDKTWELSWTRRISIVALTYIIALSWLFAIHESRAALKAFVPVAGYVLSTLSLPFIKNIWIKRQANRPHRP